MVIDILTLFPNMYDNFLTESIIKRAIDASIVEVHVHDFREYADNKHKKVDDYPYGGGAGMVMQAQPIYDAWLSVVERVGHHVRTVYLTPQGRTFSQSDAKDFAGEENLILLCGHYEGVDERVLEEIVTDYVSIGDYVLTGGELPAMVMVDAISRMVPGVLSNKVSGETESFEDGLLEYPQYSRPEEWKGKKVPAIILSGDHGKVDAWRHEQSLLRTRDRRPDLLEKASLTQKDREFLEKHQ